ncbi:MAG: phosphoglycerate kinase [Candidatus Woykebacteria bacterium]
MKSVKEALVSGKRAVVRCDLDDPILDKKVVEDTRIKSNIPTLKYLLDKGASLFLISKLGRPKGKDPNLSMRIVVDILSQDLGEKVTFKEDLREEKLAKVTLLENLRFWSGEEAGSLEFSKSLASFGDFYVNECFATSHRSDASFIGIPKFLPSFAGLNLFKEISELNKVLKSPERPLVAIISGAKLETKLPAINNLATIADKVLVGGRLMFEVSKQGLPQNVVVASDHIDQKDIGQRSIDAFTKIIDSAKTVVWNGPMGVFEEEKYMAGTKGVAEAVVRSSAYKIIGGGDTIAALGKLGLLDKIDHVSTGGGSMLEFLAGKKLPGLAALGYYNG